MKTKNENIIIKNARVHNLKGINLEIPRNKFVVITGVSGSGKSSLAFDTIYAEGQRRYVESLSSYVRQFLGRMNKPEVDMIKGIPPAIAIEQKVINNNPRSTVGTTTEIYEYLKLLYARIGHTFSPKSGKEVKRHTVDDVISHITSLPEGTTAVILVPLKTEQDKKSKNSSFLIPHSSLETLNSQGFARLMLNGEFIRISDILSDNSENSSFLIPHSSFIIACRNEISNLPSLLESIENQSFKPSEIIFVDDNSTDETYNFLINYSKKYNYIKVIKNTGKGKKSALIEASKIAQSEYLIFTDADCILNKNHCKLALEYLSKMILFLSMFLKIFIMSVSIPPKLRTEVI